MKTTQLIRALPALFCASAFQHGGVHSSFAHGTAFTYQGSLADGGAPASGIYDLRRGQRGAPVAGPLSNSPTTISDGPFTVMFDFGAGVFTGAELWLEMGVRTNGGGVFTILSPRQNLTPTPYAIAPEIRGHLRVCHSQRHWRP